MGRHGDELLLERDHPFEGSKGDPSDPLVISSNPPPKNHGYAPRFPPQLTCSDVFLTPRCVTVPSIRA
ncbi:hypothetical protein SLI_2462 [Streptomyces lividans 1326]|uniref:Uncharacterized protein n=1 Tax=Streptomyces lividans 1326 TaxID=1200984 RepID=A0A7U9DQF3_STRLI|nr:hypothetical protein SLI_2462 [Streptomyces lividans 1326]